MYGTSGGADRNSTSFSRDLRAYFEEHKYDPTDPLKYAQWLVLEYVTAMRAGHIKNGGRGLIINHHMGVGKTITAVALGEMLQAHGYSVMVIGPRTLEQNFYDNAAKLARLRHQRRAKEAAESVAAAEAGADVADPGLAVSYFTLRANNLPDQIMRHYLIGDKKDTPMLEVPANMSLATVFRRKVVIIDEAHLFFNSVAHGRNVALQVYRALMATDDCWIFPLTGTFITNSAFEAVPAYNLVAGREIFPEDEYEFMRWFGTSAAVEQNRARLQNLTSGYLSYARSERGGETTDDFAFPERLQTKIKYLLMDGTQLARYYEAKQMESRENGGGGAKGAAMRERAAAFNRGFHRDETAASYKVRSRIASNGDNKEAALVELVASQPHDLMLVQSPFVEDGGIKPMAKAVIDALEYREFRFSADGEVEAGPEWLVGKRFEPTVVRGADGALRGADRITWRDFEDADVKVAKGPGAGKTLGEWEAECLSSGGKWLACLSGGIKDAQFEALLEVLRDPINRHGALIHVLFCSNVGNLGLDLKNGRVVVCFSLGYHIEDYNQLVARYVRYGASACLPPDKRNIQPYIFVSTVPARTTYGADGVAVNQKITSTDEELLYLSLAKLKNNAAFIEVAHSVSIECLAGVSATPELCRKCLPTGRPLTTGKFAYDMALPNPCEEAAQETTAPVTVRVLVRDDDEEREFDVAAGVVREWDAETQQLGEPLDATNPLMEAILLKAQKSR